jgi:hypothetical protein
MFATGKSLLALGFFTILLPLLVAFPSDLRCSFCGKAIQGGAKYLRSGSNIFCSERCFDAWVAKTAPRCVVCGGPVSDGYAKDGKAYCSMDCVATTFPKCFICGKRSAKGVIIGGDPSKFICDDCDRKPKCAVCGIPGTLRKLQDGRLLCSNCDKTAIFNYGRAATVFDSVRQTLRERLGLSTSHPIAMELVGLDRLNTLSGKTANAGLEQGLFEYLAIVETRVSGFPGKLSESTERKDESWHIYALYGLPEDRLAEVFAHELAHDWMQESCPGIKDSKLKEGWAEYIAWRYNALSGHPDLNPRIEKNDDPVYGGGFRLIKGIADREGFDGLKRYLRKCSSGSR